MLAWQFCAPRELISNVEKNQGSYFHAQLLSLNSERR